MLMQTHKCMHVICVGVVHAQEYWLWLNCSPCWCHERNSVKIFKCAYTSMYLCTVAYQSTLQAYMQAVSLMCYTVIVLVFSASYTCFHISACFCTITDMPQRWATLRILQFYLHFPLYFHFTISGYYKRTIYLFNW